MSILNIFDQKPFEVVEFNNEVVQRVEYKPQLLGSLNLFQPIYSRSRAVAVAYKERTLRLVPVSNTGEPPKEATQEGTKLKMFRTVRLAKGSTIYAEELQGILGLPVPDQLREVQAEVADRSGSITDDIELTWEHMRLGAIQGVVYDADGTTVLWDWYSEWDIDVPTEVNFELTTETTDVRKKCRDLVRTAQKASKGLWVAGTRLGALVGDNFFDALVNHKQIKETKLGTERASSLENIQGYSAIDIENITFINYRGTDDGTRLTVGSDKAKFFPIGAPGAFQVAWAPAEFFPYVNQRGRPMYGMIITDKDRDAWRRVEHYSYPLFICTRPEMLLRAKRA